MIAANEPVISLFIFRIILILKLLQQLIVLVIDKINLITVIIIQKLFISLHSILVGFIHSAPSLIAHQIS